MIFVVDTNILLFSLINESFARYFSQNYLRDGNDLVISVVTEGELKSLALQRSWGNKKTQQLLDTVSQYIVYPIKVQTVIDAYAQLDAYSQGTLKDKALPEGMSSRNMGKNDLWIAATTYVLNSTLITTDKDFDHLHDVYLRRDFIEISRF